MDQASINLKRSWSLLDDYLESLVLKMLSGAGSFRSFRAEGSFAVGTSLGHVRSENQDAVLIAHARFLGDPARDFDLGIVCDGMGGMRDGRAAAMQAVVTFLSELLIRRDLPTQTKLKQALELVNDTIYRKLRGSGGTTLSAVFLQRNRTPMFAHAGDTRVYAIASDGRLTQISRDDTLSAALNKTPDVDDVQGAKLIQFVGMGESFEPHVFTTTEAASSILLTTDGVHGVAASTLSRVVKPASNPLDLVRRLIQLSELLGGLDNATAISVPFSFASVEEPTARSKLRLISPFDSIELIFPETGANRSPDDSQKAAKNSPAEVAKTAVDMPADHSDEQSHSKSPKSDAISDVEGVKSEMPRRNSDEAESGQSERGDKAAAQSHSQKVTKTKARKSKRSKKTQETSGGQSGELDLSKPSATKISIEFPDAKDGQ